MQEKKITIKETQNDTILKFESNEILVDGGSYEFANIDEAKNSPLAQQLFYLPFVKKVLITSNFIAIQRFDIVEWKDVQEEVKEQIENYINEGGKVVIENESKKKQPVEVYAEATPNPSVMKFGSNIELTTTDVEYKNIDEASKSSPLAKALFTFPFVKEVFISDNYISVTKYDMVEWETVFAEIRSYIREYLADGKQIFSEKIVAQESTSTITPNVKLEGIPAKIADILEEYIKPAVAGDGGNIAFKDYNESEKIVSVVLQGACSGCPSSTATLKNGIETLLKEMLPNQVNEVVAING